MLSKGSTESLKAIPSFESTLMMKTLYYEADLV